MFQRVLSRGLEAAGHTPVVTTDGLYGLEQLVQSRPDLVLLDLMLGEEDLQGFRGLGPYTRFASGTPGDHYDGLWHYRDRGGGDEAGR